MLKRASGRVWVVYKSVSYRSGIGVGHIREAYHVVGGVALRSSKLEEVVRFLQHVVSSWHHKPRGLSTNLGKFNCVANESRCGSIELEMFVVRV